MKKLIEEKENIEKVRLELEEENRRKILKKQNLMYDNQQEINKYLNHKKLLEEKNFNEKVENQNSLSLPIQHEERIENYKNMINRLSDKIDNNVNYYRQYQNNSNPMNNQNFNKIPNNFEDNNIRRDETMDYSKYNNISNNYYDNSSNPQGSNSNSMTH